MGGEDCECMGGGMWEYGEKTDPETGEMVQYMMAQSDDDDGMVYILEPDSTSFTCGDDSDEMGDEETDDGDDDLENGTTSGDTRRHILQSAQQGTTISGRHILQNRQKKGTTMKAR